MSSYYYMCVLILPYMCPHTTACVLKRLHTCPHTSCMVSAVCATRSCRLLLSHARPFRFSIYWLY